MRYGIIAWAVLLTAFCPGSTRGTEPPLTTTVVASGLARPTCVTHAPADLTRLFVTEQQTGKVRIIKNGSLLATPFLDVTGQPGWTGMSALEYGLLFICFHPSYFTNGYFYVCYTSNTPSSGTAMLARFQVSAGNPDVANPASATTILALTYTQTTHRSAWMDFGPDGYLYYNTGDGGENDPLNAASDLTVLRGKMLRLDVNGPDGVPGTADDDGFPTDANKNYRVPADNPFVTTPGAAPEIWAYGFRNPWRASFDRLTHDLYIGDVGQVTREEVDFMPAGVGGRFYGWRCKEGTFTTAYSGCTGTLPPSIAPIFEYRSGINANIISGGAVIGGYVYRGCAIPELGGTYFFGDWGGNVASFRYSPATGVTNAMSRTSTIGISGSTLSSFGEDALGEILICNWSTGEIRKIVPATAQGPDCNGNGKRDTCDIASGASADVNGNGVPDECECVTCPGDATGNGMIDGGDIQRFAACCVSGTLSGPGCRCANMNGDGAVNGADVSLFVDKVVGAGDPDPACP